ncbi:hypothetical protein P3T76_006171 [Phytophthora citrophthora]|uniref:Uncharacterized protein n=1 Tax=Phytophthora citrophthora TaxID=4793 RepID=A0AAD9GQ53_9STRA|nr:hypothetical protein P3T76_006171 [Phytophthora citrophthora]
MFTIHFEIYQRQALPTTYMKLDENAAEYMYAKPLSMQKPQEVYEDMAPRMERALGRPLPQMEVRFKNVSVSAEIVKAGIPPGRSILVQVTSSF